MHKSLLMHRYSPCDPSGHPRVCAAACLPYPLPATLGIRRPVNKKLSVKPELTSLLCNYFRSTQAIGGEFVLLPRSLFFLRHPGAKDARAWLRRTEQPN